MAISQLSTSVLKTILKLTEQRESLLGEITKIEGQIEALYAGGSVSAKAPRGRTAAKAVKASGSKSSGRRGALKEAILAALKASGDKGISVKELSEKLGVKARTSMCGSAARPQARHDPETVRRTLSSESLIQSPISNSDSNRGGESKPSASFLS